MCCIEALCYFDKRMLEHRDTAVLEFFGADDGEGGEGELLLKFAGTQERTADGPYFLRSAWLSGVSSSLTGNARVLLFGYWSRGKVCLETASRVALKKTA